MNREIESVYKENLEEIETRKAIQNTCNHLWIMTMTSSDSSLSVCPKCNKIDNIYDGLNTIHMIDPVEQKRILEVASEIYKLAISDDEFRCIVKGFISKYKLHMNTGVRPKRYNYLIGDKDYRYGNI